MSVDFNDVRIRTARLMDAPGCDYAEIRTSATLSTVVVLSGDEIDTISSGESIGGSIRVLVKGAWGFVSFNRLDLLEQSFRRAVDMASAITGGGKTALRSAPSLNGDFFAGLGPEHREAPLEEKVQLIRGYNNILKSSTLIQTTRATYRDTTGTYLYCNSEGSDLRYDKRFTGISLSSVARDGAVIQPFHESIAGFGGFETVQGKEETAQFVTKTAVDLLKAGVPEGGKYRIVADQKLAGVFIHEAFGHLSEADFVHENERMRSQMILGREFGPPDLNVIDDGSLPHTGFTPFDDEGVKAGKTYLIRNGLLAGRLHSRETAMKMDEGVTGNARAISVFTQPIVRMTNTYIDNGPRTKEEIFDAVGDGIYAIDVIGGQTNLEMFTFTCGYGYEVKNGKQGKLYKDIVLSGNVFTTLKNIAMIAGDRMMFGGLGGCGKGGQSPLPVSFGGPHLLINDVLVGGKQ